MYIYYELRQKQKHQQKMNGKTPNKQAYTSDRGEKNAAQNNVNVWEWKRERETESENTYRKTREL